MNTNVSIIPPGLDISVGGGSADNSQTIINHNSGQQNSDNKTRFNDDIFNIMTLDQCDEYFREHYENDLEQFTDAKERLALLRYCVELLDRLDGSPNSHFAGRLSIFLAKVIPLFDQSGTNARSEFNNHEQSKNVKNHLHQIACRKSEKEKLIGTDHDMEEGETLSDESNDATPQDDVEKTYERFWKIQRLLDKPNLLYEKSIWSPFRSNIDILLYKLEKTNPMFKVWDLKRDYMTDPKALALQINDVALRRCLMLQILIVLQYLELPVESRPENLVLDRSQLSWSSSTIKKIFSLLETLPNKEEGIRFRGFVQHTLRNEELWNQWKNEKCKEPPKPQDEEDIPNMRGTYHKRRKISDELNSAKPYNIHVIGSQDMSRLWNMKAGQKFAKPDLGKFINIPSEKQNELFKDPNYSFKVLRLVRKNRHFFASSSSPISSIEDYLKEFVSRYLN